MNVKNREPLSRVWFMGRGYKQAPTEMTNGHIVYVHPDTNTALSQYGTKLVLNLVPKEKFKKTAARYLKFSHTYGSVFLAHVKYVTFVGPIPKGCQIDHIDGDSMNNKPDNLRAVLPEINRRDGGFLQKARNKSITLSLYPTRFILRFYDRMAEYKATRSHSRYERLTRTDMLKMLAEPDFNVVVPGAD